MNGGAVAYLTHSQYGRNRNEVSINNSYITGNSAGKPGDWSTKPNETYKYNSRKGMLASTTGNIYGVYDMSGGADEYTAGWNTLSSSTNIKSYGKAVDGTVYFTIGGISDKYKTAYSNGTEETDGEIIKTVCKTGDGIKETYTMEKITTLQSHSVSWFFDMIQAVNIFMVHSEYIYVDLDHLLSQYPENYREQMREMYESMRGCFGLFTIYNDSGSPGSSNASRLILIGNV